MRDKRFLIQLKIIIIVIINVKLTTSAESRCPDGYFFNDTDQLCYPTNPKPCPFENITTTTSASITENVLPSTTTTTTPMPPTTTTTTSAPTTEKVLPSTTTTPMPPTTTTTIKPTTEKVLPSTTTTPLPPKTTTTSPTLPPKTTTTSPTLPPPPPQAEQLLHCPSGTVLIDNYCRKIICPLGEYHKGSCLHPACPPGLVWRGKSCQAPGYVTTILEIDNVITNDFIESPITIERSTTNEIVYHTTTTTTTTRKPRTTPSYTTTERTTTKASPTNPPEYKYGCCTVVTPRICKKYGEKWICFNRRHKRCDSRICTAPVVYLKAPEIKYDSPVLVMPPNPEIDSCLSSSCNNTDVVDCSGCASNHPEFCSSYCYRYMCPEATCSYMDLNAYCSYFPQQFGCFKEDGCLWNWC